VGRRRRGVRERERKRERLGGGVKEGRSDTNKGACLIHDIQHIYIGRIKSPTHLIRPVRAIRLFHPRIHHIRPITSDPFRFDPFVIQPQIRPIIFDPQHSIHPRPTYPTQPRHVQSIAPNQSHPIHHIQITTTRTVTSDPLDPTRSHPINRTQSNTSGPSHSITTSGPIISGPSHPHNHIRTLSYPHHHIGPFTST
jgi:hypothetical protein